MTSFQLVKVRGIPVRIHFSLLLILPLLAFLFGNQLGIAAEAAQVPPERLGGSPALWGLGVAVALFLSVLLHEFAHVWWAIRSGGSVKDVTLMMIGGVSRIDRPPARPRDEAIMAAMGPLTSLLLGAGFLFLWAALAPLQSWNLRMLVFYVGQLNIILGIFNLLPAFPMDGGRIVRAVLVPRLGKAKATRIASTIGRGFAILFALLGALSFNILLMVVGVFIYLAASAEAQQVMLEDALEGLRVKDVMTPGPDRVSVYAPLSIVVEDMRARRVLGVTVVDENGKVAGVTTLDMIKKTAPLRDQEARASDAMVPVEPVGLDTLALDALKRLVESRVPVLPVVDAERVVGTVTQQDFVRTMEFRRALNKRRGVRTHREVEA
jgi:Zn-dependent protease/CBS domain-containing protein